MNFRLLTILAALCLLAISCRGATNDIASDLTHLTPSPKKALKPKPKGAAALMTAKPMFPALPPLPPFKSAVAAPRTATLAWASPYTLFKLYQGIASGQYLLAWQGTTTNATVALLRGTNFFVATAMDAQGQQSDYSNEVSTNGPPILRTNIYTLRWESSDATGAWLPQGIAAGPFTNSIPGTMAFHRIRSDRSTGNDSIWLQVAPTPTGPWTDAIFLNTFTGKNRQFRLTGWVRTTQ